MKSTKLKVQTLGAVTRVRAVRHSHIEQHVNKRIVACWVLVHSTFAAHARIEVGRTVVYIIAERISARFRWCVCVRTCPSRFRNVRM